MDLTALRGYAASSRKEDFVVSMSLYIHSMKRWMYFPESGMVGITSDSSHCPTFTRPVREVEEKWPKKFLKAKTVSHLEVYYFWL